jgi:hypothetical protein
VLCEGGGRGGTEGAYISPGNLRGRECHSDPFGDSSFLFHPFNSLMLSLSTHLMFQGC